MINLGIFSLWTATPNFKLTRSYAMLFSAAIAHARNAVQETELVTDARGLEIADRLGWNLTSHSIALEDFCPESARHVWMLGKIRAQQIQSRPFVHIDLDLILVSAMPPRLSCAAVMAQSRDNPRSYLDALNQRIASHVGISSNAVPYNTGLLGWNDMTFCRDYCERSMRLSIMASKHFDHGGCVSIVCEQLLLGEMARDRRIQIATAIPIPTHSDARDMRDFQFAHFWGRSKENYDLLEKVEQRFANEFPSDYANFVRGIEKLIPISQRHATSTQQTIHGRRRSRHDRRLPKARHART